MINMVSSLKCSLVYISFTKRNNQKKDFRKDHGCDLLVNQKSEGVKTNSRFVNIFLDMSKIRTHAVLLRTYLNSKFAELI